jgi:fibro-slime domain-containing protein
MRSNQISVWSHPSIPRTCLLLFLALVVSASSTAAFTLTGTVRDFQSSHPDFENGIGFESGLVETQLGPDGKPVYAGGGGTGTTHGQELFDQWFRDTLGVNMWAETSIEMELSGDIYEFESNAFFPIDEQLFGNTPGYPHNYHFTHEFVAQFTYERGFTVEVQGDDDIWIFINGLLGIDLGGVHPIMAGSITIDYSNEDSFEMVPGNSYDLAIFRTERHTSESNFLISTSLPLTQEDLSSVPEFNDLQPPARLYTPTPNPANQMTRIGFDLAEPKMVKLAIYAVDGSMVKELINEGMAAGTHQTLWQGRDEQGRAVSSGTYFCRLKVGEFVETKRMVFTR